MLPEDAVAWIEALAALRQDVDDPKIHPFRQHLVRGCMRTAEALLAEESGTQRPSPSELLELRSYPRGCPESAAYAGQGHGSSRT
jgi:hypothetical protein